MEKTVKEAVGDIALMCADLMKYADNYDRSRFYHKGQFNKDVRAIQTELKNLKALVKRKEERKKNVKKLDFNAME